MPRGSRQIADSLELALSASRLAHAVVTTGAVRHDTAQVGTLALPVAGIRLKAGDRLQADLATPGVGKGASVLITLATNPADYGKRQSFHVKVDGRELLSLGEVDPGGGVTRSYFVDLIARQPKIAVEIEADAATAAPVTVSVMRCYAGLTHEAQVKARANPPKEKMGLALVSPKGMGYTIDAPTLKELFRALPASPYLQEQAAVLYNFCSRGPAENQAEIDRLAALAEDTNVPLRIAFQVHWGGVPRGLSDGAGGTFTDIPYQQISYDPQDAYDDPGLAALMGDRNDIHYGLSIPNVWSNTPWLTYNHPRLNQLRQIRLTQALYAWREARERLAVAGKARLLPGQLSTGDETIYWAQGVDDRKFTEVNGGVPRSHLSADFNPFTVADALRDGVNLDPRDGLDARERLWLHQNLARQQQRLIDWMFAALPAEAVQMAPGGPHFGLDLVRHNLFTEPYAMPLFPMKELGTTHPGMELGFVNHAKSGGEYWSGEALPWLLKARERGRIALPNLECTGAPPPQLLAALRSAYACGARFATLYNWDKGSETPKVLRSFASGIEHPAAEEFPPATTGPNVGVGKRWEREYTAGPAAFGINRVEVYGLEIPAVIPARLTLRAADGAEVTVPGTLRPTTGRPTVSSFSLPALFIQQPEKRYTLVLEIDSANPPSVALATDGKIAVRLVSDLALERARSRAIAEWQDAADILSSLAEIHAKSPQPRFAEEALERAQEYFKHNLPRDAYTAAIRAEQLAMPSSYHVAAPGGRLAPYWINVDAPAGAVTATITAYDDRTASVTIRSAVAQTVELRRGAAHTKATLSPNVPAEITLDLRPRR